jgi:hypothetical protein
MPKDKEAFEGIPDAYFPAVVQFLQQTASANLAAGSLDRAAVDALAALANEEHASVNPQHGRNVVDIVFRTLKNRALFDVAHTTPTANSITNFTLDLVDLGNFW